MSDAVTRREWIIALIIALIATAVMQIPYLLGYVLARPNTEFTGLVINLEDASYLAIILQGYSGAWQYHIQFTSEPHAPAFLYGFYLALGHLARFLNLSTAAIWHASRAIAAIILFATTFGFTASFLADPLQRRVAYLISVFGAGFDWTTFPFERVDPASGVPVDFKMPEAHLFFSALTYPHFSIGIALILISFWLARHALERGQWRYALAAGFANLLLGIVYPFLMYLVAAALGAFWLYRAVRAREILWQHGFLLGVVFAIPAPLYAYYQSVLITNPVFKIWDAQAITFSPNPLHYLLAYGGMLALGTLTLQKDAERFAFLWIWVAVAAVLLYLPLNTQRRFVEGLQIPLAILATTGLFQVFFPHLEQTRALRTLASRPHYSVEGLRRLIFIAILVLMSSANIVILLRLSVMTALEQPDPLFRPLAEMQAMDWLRDHSARGDLVLSSYPTASYIPARSGNSVFVGQRYETNRFEEKRALAEMFFDSKTADAWRRDFLARYRVAYVFVTPRERELGNFNSANTNYLVPVLSNASVTIYRVQP